MEAGCEPVPGSLGVSDLGEVPGARVSPLAPVAAVHLQFLKGLEPFVLLQRPQCATLIKAFSGLATNPCPQASWLIRSRADDLPQPGGLVPASGEGSTAVGAERHRPHPAVVGEGGEELAGRDLP